jgi:hypothetical protein
MDADAGNNGGEYRNDDVDIEKCGRGGYDIGWTVTGEWLAYDVEAPLSGKYTISILASSGAQGTKSMHIEMDGENISGPISFDEWDGWQEWHTLTKKDIAVNSGAHELRLVVDAGLFNLAEIRFEKAP